MTQAPVRAVLYLRISQDREMDGRAIGRHREACEKIAADRGWQIIEEYVDQSKSATDKTKGSAARSGDISRDARPEVGLYRNEVEFRFNV